MNGHLKPSSILVSFIHFCSAQSKVVGNADSGAEISAENQRKTEIMARKFRGFQVAMTQKMMRYNIINLRG
jgi:hypothetical protein